MKTSPRSVIVGIILSLVLAPLAWAGATVLAVAGTVNMEPAKGGIGPLAQGQRVETGATITTGPNSRTSLRFDDGQMIVLQSEALFVVNEYKFDAHKPKEGGFTASLIRGAMRAVTGLIGEHSKANVAIKTPQATIGIRGTDFQLHVENQLYLLVNQGAISATSDAGSSVFDANNQPAGAIASRLSPPRPAALSEFPAGVQASFRQLQSQPINGEDAGRRPNDPTCSDRR